MAYHFDETSGDIIIDSFQNGIGASPYQGLTDMRNINITSVPGEANINFSTAKISSGAISGSLTSVSGTTDTFSGGAGLENYIAIYFIGLASYSGIALGTPYWVASLSGSTFKLYSDYNQTNVVTITGTGTAAFKAYQIGITPSYVAGGTSPIQHFAQPTNITSSSYNTFGVDGNGLVWSNFYVTGTNSYWTYTGNPITDGTGMGGGGGGATAFPDIGNLNSAGNGLVYWRVSNGAVGTSVDSVDYLFVFRNSQIDFFVAEVPFGSGPSTGVWTLGWDPSTASTGASNYLATPPGASFSHHAIVASDGNVYFCDGDNVEKFFQTSSTTIFNPTSASTFTYETFPLLPVNDVAQCLAPLGTTILIGGQGYNAYVWDTVSTLVSYYIPIAEPFIARMVTVNTNTYIFAGNRGRIYITNGSQAQLWQKVPDHVSGTIEPRFIWGGATAVKNQLYFSFTCTSNAGSTINNYGGIWAVDLATQAIRLANQLSYGTYSGYASALLPQLFNPTVSVAGTGTALWIGWYDGSSTYGVDIPSTSVYTNSQALVTSDLIPIGTHLKPQTPLQFEFKLSAPLLANESMQLWVGSYLDMSYASFVEALNISGSNTKIILSGNSQDSGGSPVQAQEWLIVQVIFTGSATPSFNRLVQIRVVGEGIKQTAMYNAQ